MNARARRPILFVDDEPQILSGISLNLRRHYEVLCAQSGAQGLELLERRPDIEVIISDMRMPGMDGAKFLAAAREINPRAGRIMLTGYFDIASAIAAVNDGRICRFLTKPCSVEQLIESIEIALRERQAAWPAGAPPAQAPGREAGAEVGDPSSSRDRLIQLLEETVAERQLTKDSPGALFLVQYRLTPASREELDSFGVEAVLGGLIERLRTRFPALTCIAVWGPCKIMVFDANCTRPNEALEAGRDLVEVALRPFQLGGGEITIEASVGVVEIPDALLEPKNALKHAEIAAQEAEHKGGNAACIFTPESGAAYEYRRTVFRELKTAIADESLNLLYHPIVDLRTSGNVFAVEALARWTHPTLGSIAPATFIPLAESTGLIPALGEWALRRACREAPLLLNDWCARIAVNVSVMQLLDAGFLAAVRGAFENAGLDPARLMIEVTESVFAERVEPVCGVLETLRRMGVMIAIDDFGAGYSSLAYLSRLPIDVLKIDGAFMKDFDRQGGTIIGTTLDLARKLGIHAVVEGVENAEMLRKALSVGASLLQGYQFARPMAADALDQWTIDAFGGRNLRVLGGGRR